MRSKKKWYDPYDGKPISHADRRMIEKARIEAHENRTYTTKELWDLMDEEDGTTTRVD